MTLQPGCRFVVAPHFHLPADWPRRLLVGAGVDEADGGSYSREAWRPPTADELAVLLGPSDEPTSPQEAAESVCLFQLPEHLRSAWWDLLERAAADLGEGRLPGFDAFVNRVVEFLAFKDLPGLEGARCTLVVSKPGHRSARWGQPLWGGINLGDEDTSVVLINRPYRQRDAELPCPDYSPVRLQLRSGEGLCLPWGSLILDGYPADKQEPDVMLLISHEGTSPA
jgi:hypothetical protein